MRVGEHTHEWTTRYVTFDGRYDCAEGMECECGLRLTQDTVEDAVNEVSPPADLDAEGWVINADGRRIVDLHKEIK